MCKIQNYSETPIPIKNIADTWELAFNKKFNPEYFNWRFKNNPNEKKIYLKYIMDKETLAAYYAVSPMLMKKGNQVIKIALSNMTMTHPNYRGKGYFQLLASRLYEQLKAEGYSCIFTYPVREVSCHIFRKYLNFKDVALLKTMNLSNDNHRQLPITDYSFEYGKVDKNIINLAQSFSFTKKNFLILRDTENLKWRLINNPINDYYYLKVSKSRKTKLIIFYKYFNESIDIMDFCYSNENYEQGLDFSTALTYIFILKNPKITAINIWTDIDSKEFNFLRSLKFVPTSTNTFFGIIPLNNDKSLYQKENWHYRYFDSDVF